MRILLLTLLLTFSTLSYLLEIRQVALHVDLLGKKHTMIRYYHPIEGNYTVTLSDYVHTKKAAKFFPECVFIDPRIQLTDSLTHVQANSLRHYADPNELIYIDWQWDSDTTNVQDLAHFRIISERIRAQKYQEQINTYFQPFYFRIGEVSNLEYREFIWWVRDSLFKEAIYHSDEFTDEEVFGMLSVPNTPIFFEELGESKTPAPADREMNRKMFPFKQDFEIAEAFTDQRTVPVLSQFYLQPNERWYKRRELDVKKLKYRYTQSPGDTLKAPHVCTVYPDTLGWAKDSKYFFNDPFSNMYFWHAAYDKYPVVGVSWDQAKAYCHWKEQQLNAKHPELTGQFTIDLPRVYEYEQAVCAAREYQDQLVIQDNELLTNLLLNDSSGQTGQFHELLAMGLLGYTEPIYRPIDPADQKARKQLEKWIDHQIKISQKNGYALAPANYKNTVLQRATQNYLPNGIRFLSNNVSEWMLEDYQQHYEKLLQAYINYHCIVSIDYCEYQRMVDQQKNLLNPKNGKLILGSNWFDERYEMVFGVNIGGLYAKRFQSPDKSHSTVGFRYVVRIKH